jgi:outer membrane protein TolC
MKNFKITPFLLCLSFSLLALCACTPKFARAWADREIFGILNHKKQNIPGANDSSLASIEPPLSISLAHLPKLDSKVDSFLQHRSHVETKARQLTLEQALEFAAKYNRPFLSQKENVYITALDLSLIRQRYGPVVSGGGEVTYAEQQTINANLDKIEQTSHFLSSPGIGIDVLLRTGMRVGMDLTSNFLEIFSSGGASLVNSNLAFSATQPLLQGAGILAAVEPLRQEERNVLYAIRDFTQDRKTLVITTLSDYYRTLQLRESAKNAYIAYEAFAKVVDRERNMIENNPKGRSGLALIEQAFINYERRWLNALRNYEVALDDFKIKMGIPVTEKIVLDRSEIDQLDLTLPKGSLDEMIQTAMVTRLDLWNLRDQVADAERKIKIAKQNLLPIVNLHSSYTMGDRTERNFKGDSYAKGIELTPRVRDWDVGLDIDLNLNSKPERNALREAEITLNRVKRNLDLEEERIRSQIRANYRDLELSSKLYDVASRGMSINQNRLEMEEALAKEGLGTARDLVEAQRDYVEARDASISATINFTIAKLQLWRDIGILPVNDQGHYFKP